MDNRGIKILVVEDDADIRDIMIMVLEMEGYCVSSLDNGMMVSEELRRDKPDAILLDVQLGDSNGLAICQEIKSDPATMRIPVMIVSATHGYGKTGDPTCEADDYLAKPFDIEVLLRKVRKLAA